MAHTETTLYSVGWRWCRALAGGYCLRGAENQAITVEGFAQPRLKELVRPGGATSYPCASAGTSHGQVCGH